MLYNVKISAIKSLFGLSDVTEYAIKIKQLCAIIYAYIMPRHRHTAERIAIAFKSYFVTVEYRGNSVCGKLECGCNLEHLDSMLSLAFRQLFLRLLVIFKEFILLVATKHRQNSLGIVSAQQIHQLM